MHATTKNFPSHTKSFHQSRLTTFYLLGFCSLLCTETVTLQGEHSTWKLAKSQGGFLTKSEENM